MTNFNDTIRANFDFLKSSLIEALKDAEAVVTENVAGCTWINGFHVRISHRGTRFSRWPGLVIQVDGTLTTRKQSYELLEVEDVPLLVPKILKKIQKNQEAQSYAALVEATRRAEHQRTAELVKRFKAAGFEVSITQDSLVFGRDKADYLLALLEEKGIRNPT